MSRRGRVSAAVAAMAVVGSIGAGAVVAASTSSDEAALRQQRGRADRNVERRVDALLAKMTLKEKLGQLTLLSDGQLKDDPAEARTVGAVFSETDPALINKYQRDAVKHSRLHIPILFAYDTIHGFRTIFPIPLATASSFDPDVAFTDHKVGAFESAAVGIKQIYSPMVDVSHEPRWGRISEAAGEDPYLNSVMAAARVTGAQGSDYSAPDKTVTSVKHYVAYGQPESGRDYNTTDMSEQRLRNVYLPPFKAAIDAGSDTVMCSFNAINGVAGCANPYTETRILKREWGFDGFIESDYTAVAELRACPPSSPTRVRADTASRPTAPEAAAPRAQRRHGLRDGLHELPRLRQGAGREPQSVDEAHRRRRAPRSCASSSAPGCSSIRTSTSPRRPASSCCPRTARRLARPPRARWSCSRTTARCCRSRRARRRR